MGERDRQEREEIENTLSRAWSMWVEGINWQPQDPSTVAGGSLQYDSNSEYDSREYEMDHDTLEERNNTIETFTSTFCDDLKNGRVKFLKSFHSETLCFNDKPCVHETVS